MKFHRFILLLTFALSMSAHAFKPKIEIIEQFDDLKMVAFISEEVMQNNPEWNPENDAPPLTVVEAIRAVKSLTKTLKPIKEIEIRRSANYKNKWHYLIKSADSSMSSDFDIYVVLMSGKVIPGIIEPQGYK